MDQVGPKRLFSEQGGFGSRTGINLNGEVSETKSFQ